MGNMSWGMPHPCTLRTSFADLKKEKAYCSCYNRLNLFSLPKSPDFSDKKFPFKQCITKQVSDTGSSEPVA